jgi:arsenate reductase
MGFNFLVVDPSAEQRDRMSELLMRQFPDSEVAQAEDGRSGLRSLSAKRVHAVLCAWRMPVAPGGLDGEGLVQALRRNMVLAKKPVIAFGAEAASKEAYKGDPQLCFLDNLPPTAVLGGILRSMLEEKGAVAPAAPAAEAPASGRKILFLSVNASVRGPMAEGLASKYLGGDYIAASAGFKTGSIHPLAIQVMAEEGLDISGLPSRAVRDLDMTGVEIAVNLCFNEIAPMVAGRLKRYDWPVPDPVKGGGDEAALLARFRQARDSITRRLQKLAEEIRRPALAA